MKKRWFIVPLCALALVSVLVATAVCTDPDFTAPIPLGQEVDLVVGLNSTERANAIEKHNDKNPSLMVELRTISTNLKKYFSEDVYGGCYFTGVIEKDPQLYFLLTDLSAAPEIENERVHFIEVKYTYKELSRYRDMVLERYLNKGLQGIGISQSLNKVTAYFVENTDIPDLYALIPEDAIMYIFEPAGSFQPASTTIENGAEILTNTASASIGFPVSWGINNSSKGWLTAGHFLQSAGIPVSYRLTPFNVINLGVSYHSIYSGTTDAATILRSSDSYISSPYAAFGDVIDYQESTTAGLPDVGDTVEYIGKKTDASQLATIVDPQFVATTDPNKPSLYGLVLTSPATIAHGDSGGPVLLDNENGTYTAVGIISGIHTNPITGATQMYYSRIKLYSYRYS